MDGPAERERLKEVYKQHFQSIKELKKKAADAERLARIQKAVDQINASSLMERFEGALQKVREKIDYAEARLHSVMESQSAADPDPDFEDTLNRAQAKATVEQLRQEMGLLNSELENQLRTLGPTAKTLGLVSETVANTTTDSDEEKKSESHNRTKQKPSSDVRKTIGPANG